MTNTDIAIDPTTRDLVVVGDAFAEQDDSRTAVLMQLMIEFGRWCGNPRDGSRLREMLRAPEPVTVAELLDETLRALQVLVDDGVISDVAADVSVDAAGRPVFLLNYVDAATGRPVDLSLSTLGA